MKFKKIFALGLVLTMAVGMLSGCSSSSTDDSSDDTSVVAEVEDEDDDSLTEDDLKDVLKGVKDHYILQDAKNIDYLHGIVYNGDVILDVTEDSSKVDLSKTGTYKVTYTVTVDRTALDEYNEAKAAADDKDATSTKNTETSNDSKAETTTDETNTKSDDTEDTTTKDDTTEKDDTSADEEDDSKTDDSDDKDSDDADEEERDTSDDVIEDVEIEKEMEVVDEETAQDLADDGEVVWGDDNEPVDKSDGFKVEDDEETLDSNKSVSATDKSSGSSSSASGSSSSSSSSSSHTHNWVAQTTTVTHDATGHYEYTPVYESRAICNKCGADITNNLDHIFECNSSYTVKKVQTGTTQTWVQDSAAYTETVTTGYVCSICGATK